MVIFIYWLGIQEGMNTFSDGIYPFYMKKLLSFSTDLINGSPIIIQKWSILFLWF